MKLAVNIPKGKQEGGCHHECFIFGQNVSVSDVLRSFLTGFILCVWILTVCIWEILIIK